MLSISGNKTNKFISIYPDTRYKLMLGYSSYFVNNIKKYQNSIEPFKTKEKVYKVLNPYNYQIINQNNEEVIDIKKAFETKYKISFNSQKYYQIFEVIKKFINKEYVFSDNEIVSTICKLLKVKCDNKETKHDAIIIDNLNNHYSDILTSIKNVLNKDGMFIIKIRTILSNDIVCFINSLCSLFKNVDIYRPKVTNIWLGNKYIVCKGFNQKEVKNNCSIDTGILERIIEINNITMTEQAVNINRVVDYIDKRNYFSDEYFEYFEKQKKAHNKWIETFLKNWRLLIISPKNWFIQLIIYFKINNGNIFVVDFVIFLVVHMDYDFSELDDNTLNLNELIFNNKNHVNYSGLGMYIFNGPVSTKNILLKLEPSLSTSDIFKAAMNDLSRSSK